MASRPAIEVVGVDHVAINVSDLDRALEFYHETLGLPIRDRNRYERVEVPYVAVVAGGLQLNLVPTDEPVERTGEHLCLLCRSEEVDSRDELSELLDHFQAQGIEVEEGEPEKRYGTVGRAWSAYVRDPDGRRVELKYH